MGLGCFYIITHFGGYFSLSNLQVVRRIMWMGIFYKCLYHLSSQHFCSSRLKSHSENLKIWINPSEVWKYLPGGVTGQTRCALTSTFWGDCNSTTHDHIWICFGVVISCRFWWPFSIMTSYRFASRWRFLTNYMLFSIYTLSWFQWDRSSNEARPLATPRSCPRP